MFNINFTETELHIEILKARVEELNEKNNEYVALICDPSCSDSSRDSHLKNMDKNKAIATELLTVIEIMADRFWSATF